MALWVHSCALTSPFVATVWSDDEWLKKFSGKTLEENKEEGGAEAPKTEAQEVGKTTRAIWYPKGREYKAEKYHLNLLFFLFLPRRSLLPRNPG